MNNPTIGWIDELLMNELRIYIMSLQVRQHETKKTMKYEHSVKNVP
jgi:hypothetical protein